MSIDLEATSNYFSPGHRIRVEISSSNFLGLIGISMPAETITMRRSGYRAEPEPLFCGSRFVRRFTSDSGGLSLECP